MVDIKEMNRNQELLMDADKYTDRKNYELHSLENLVNLNQKLKWDKFIVPIEYVRLNDFKALSLNQSAVSFFANLKVLKISNVNFLTEEDQDFYLRLIANAS